jgi:outer membrane protein TolC
VLQNLEQARQRVKDLQNLEKNGLLARNDLLKAELQASNIELSLTDAENNWQLANVNMDLLLGFPEKTILLPDSSLINQQLIVQPLEYYLQGAINQRKDLASLELKNEAARTGVKSVKAEYYPSIQATAGYVAADIPKLVTITNAANIGLGVSYSLGSLWKTKAKVKEAEARVNQLSATQELLNDNIKLQVNKAYLNWLSSQKKIEVYAKAIEQADENFRIVNNKYKNNLATTTDLLEADVAQLQAHLNYVFARADAIVVYNELLKVSGLISSTK